MNQELIINIPQELDKSRRKIILAQQKVDRLTTAGLGERHPDVKYWDQELKDWTNYANQLNDLQSQYQQIAICKTIMGSGKTHIAAENDGRHIKFLPKKCIPAEILESIPVKHNYSGNNPSCRVCSASGTELHHWAPKELFPETYNQWPTDYLCKECHQEWHDKITNPYRKLRNRRGVNGD